MVVIGLLPNPISKVHELGTVKLYELPSVRMVAIVDALTSLEFARESLKLEGLTTFWSTNFEEGLALILQEHPQIVLLDLPMSPANGLEALDRILNFDHAID